MPVREDGSIEHAGPLLVIYTAPDGTRSPAVLLTQTDDGIARLAVLAHVVVAAVPLGRGPGTWRNP